MKQRIQTVPKSFRLGEGPANDLETLALAVKRQQGELIREAVIIYTQERLRRIITSSNP